MRVLALVFGPAVFCVTALAQPGLTTVDLRNLLGGRSISVPQTIGEKAQAASDALAASSDSKLETARSEYFRYQAEGKHEQEARARALMSRRRQSDLALQKDRALDEMRHGEFCSGCWQTKSQILAKGEQFPHQGQHVVVATQEQLAAKAKEFDSEIDKAKGEERRALHEADAAAQARTEAAQQVIDSFLPWKEAMRTEDEGRAKAWDAAVASYKERFDAYQQELRSLDAAIARARAAELRPETVRNLQDQKEDCQARLRFMVNEVQQDYFRRSMQEALFEQRVASGRKQLEAFVSEVGGPPLDVLTSLTSLPGIATVCPLCPNGTSDKVRVPGTPFSITTTNGAPGLNASLGLFKASLRISDDWLRNTLHVDVTLGLDAPYGQIQGGIRQTTTWGPDGTSTTVSPIGNVPKPPNPYPDPLELLKGGKKP